MVPIIFSCCFWPSFRDKFSLSRSDLVRRKLKTCQEAQQRIWTQHIRPDLRWISRKSHMCPLFSQSLSLYRFVILNSSVTYRPNKEIVVLGKWTENHLLHFVAPPVMTLMLSWGINKFDSSIEKNSQLNQPNVQEGLLLVCNKLSYYCVEHFLLIATTLHMYNYYLHCLQTS